MVQDGVQLDGFHHGKCRLPACSARSTSSHWLQSWWCLNRQRGATRLGRSGSIESYMRSRFGHGRGMSNATTSGSCIGHLPTRRIRVTGARRAVAIAVGVVDAPATGAPGRVLREVEVRGAGWLVMVG